MSFVVQGEITIDAKGAVTGVKVTKGELAGLGKVAKRTEADLDRIVRKTAGVGKTSGASAMQVANLQAQFNDIGVMLAAGQNPFQLAMQQGTQVNQVLTEMGGGTKALKALGDGFMSMINPMSLATLGIIAGGAALVQWAMSSVMAEDKAASFEDGLEALNEALSDYSSYTDIARTSTVGLAEEFGAASPDAQALADVLAEFARIDAMEALKSSIAAVTSEFGGLSNELVAIDYQRGLMASLFDNGAVGLVSEYRNTMLVLKEELGITEQQASRVAFVLRTLDEAEGVEATASAAAVLNQELINVFGSAEAIPAPLREMARNAAIAALGAAELSGAMSDVVQSQDEIEAGLRRIAAGQTTINAQTTNYINEMAAAFAHAQDLKDEIGEAAFEVLRLAGIDISGPLENGQIKAAELAAQLNVSFNEGLRTAAALDRIRSFSSGNTVQMIGQITKALGVSTAQAIELARAMPGYTDGGVSGPDGAITQSRQIAGVVNRDVQIFEPVPPIGPSGGGTRSAGRGAAASSANQEREAVEDLIVTLQEELELTRETDPVMQEMIGYRDQLKSATDDERAAIEDLIRTRIEEEATMERSREQWDLWRDVAQTALTDVNGALEMVLQSFQTAALFGTGPLGGLFGGVDDNGSGGLFGMIFDGIGAKADGGPILGAGGPRADKELNWTSPGEYIINAAATSRNRALLDQINYGGGRLADGGIIGRQISPSGAGPSSTSGTLNVTINVEGAMGDRDIEERARAGAAAAIAQYDDMLPLRVREISANPEWVGG